ncbi:unnamed protein product [Protopolystoma xenopodis]|uniref:Glutathione synthetase n=1 Tax=Protopolystoma xenopodis TaxID=117903 RepID=A0A3S5C5R3_9PLAT|nr:unnamed protein product [Protopolystoma xenopodis]
MRLNRSDYMVHLNVNAPREDHLSNLPSFCASVRLNNESQNLAKSTLIEHSLKAYNVSGMSLKQVEFNMMASSFGGMMQRLSRQHKTLLSIFGIATSPSELPSCQPSSGFAQALLKAYSLYISDLPADYLCQVASAPAILFIVSDDESNIYDQLDLIDAVEQEAQKRDGAHIALIYFRHGYSPDHFPDEQIWEIKWDLESSRAIKCPCIQYMLANTKLIQAALASPRVIEDLLTGSSLTCLTTIASISPAQYTSPSNNLQTQLQPENTFTQIARRCRLTFARQLALSPDLNLSSQEDIDQLVREALSDPDKFVLKPQREGGGNNYFGGW